MIPTEKLLSLLRLSTHVRLRTPGIWAGCCRAESPHLALVREDVGRVRLSSGESPSPCVKTRVRNFSIA